MKLVDVAGPLDLLEMIDTSPGDVAWSVSNDYQHRGSFQLDGNSYVVEVDEYTALGLHVLDVGFTTNWSSAATKGSLAASRAIGAVVNALRPKIKEIDPDAIFFSVKEGTGLEDSRQRLYDRISSRVMAQRLLPYTFSTGWIVGPSVKVKVLSKQSLTQEQLDSIITAVQQSWSS